MKQLLIVTTLCASMNLSAQEYYSCPGFEPVIEKSMACTQSSVDYKNKYRLQSSYIPWTSPFVDEIVIPINLVVLADDYGEQGAFKPADWTAPFGSSTYNVYAGYYINQAFKSTALPSDPVPGYPDTYWLNSTRNTKIRIEFNQVYYYSNTEVLNKPFSYDYRSASGSYGAVQKLHLTAHPEAAKFINCYLIKNVWPGAGGEAVTLSDTLSVFSSTWDNPADGYRWINMSDYMFFNKHLPHELGHHFNLRHTYNSGEYPSGIDALHDVFIPPFTTEQSCPAGGDPEESATDMCTNNIMSGHDKSWFVSPLQAGRIHRTLRTNVTRHFAYGTSATPHTITADETWDFTYKSYNSIVIKKGATLTLTCRLEMSKGAKIIIEPGATLVVDGGYITAARSAGPDHEGWWPGIEVWGNDSLSQTGAGKQGKLVTKNGAVIEHAHEAIQVWKPDAWNTGGGIVDCRNTTFRNNRRSCAYYPYHSYNASKTFEYPNKGIFRECTFVWDDNYKSPDNISCGISLFHVNGVMIQGCSFADNRTGTQAYRPDGIGSLDAGYTVVGIDLNPGTPSAPNVDHYYDETDYIVSSFSNLKNGIQAMSSNTLFPIKVDHAKFENCATGVLVDAMDNVVITRNKFDKNTNYHLENPTMLQLVFRNATGYTIEGNLFDNTHSLGGSGTAIYNSGQENNAVYRNKFNGLTENNYANGFNSNDLSDANSKGLSWKCNEMTNGRYDLMDFVASYSSAPDGEGVKLMQGSASAPAGNIFSSSIIDGGLSYDRHINHIDLDVLKYYYNTSAEKPTEVSGNVTEIWSSTAKKCPSSFEPTIGEISKELGRMVPAGPDARASIKNTSSGILTQTAALQDLLSKGNRPQLHELAAGMNEGNRAAIHKTLLGESPYLSVSLLEQLGKTDPAIYPRDWYRDLLIANIEAAADPALMQTLNAGAFHMPVQHIRDIEKAQTTTITERGKKEQGIAGLTEQMNMQENLAVNTLLTDSVAVNWMDAAQLIRDNSRELRDMDLVSLHFSRNSVGEAIAVLDSLEHHSGNYLLARTAGDVKEFSEFNRYLLSITGNTGKVKTLQAAEIAELGRMAANFRGKAARLAQNTLCFFTGQCEPPVVVYDLPEESSASADRSLNTGKAKPVVYPNPNSGMFTVIVPDGRELAGISVADLVGKPYAVDLHPVGLNSFRLELKNPENGVYLMRTSYKDGSAYTSKIIVAQ